jgi:hypothetical protein
MRGSSLELGGGLAAGIVVGLTLGLVAAAMLTTLTAWQLGLAGALAVVIVVAGASALQDDARTPRRERRSPMRSALVVLGLSWIGLDAADGELRSMPAALGIEPWMAVGAAGLVALAFAAARRVHRRSRLDSAAG